MCNSRPFACVSILVIIVCLLTSCGQDTSPESTVSLPSPSAELFTSPLSPVATPSAPSSVSSSATPDIGRVYAARVRGAWAQGYPYPVFFLDVPRGTTKVVVREVVYGTEELLSGAHPRLEKVIQEIVWPGGSTARIIATDFYYDETAGLLLTYDATLDNTPLDTAAPDVFSSSGVGIAFLGDAAGVNVFFNCAAHLSMDFRELSATEEGQPTEVIFVWTCDGDDYKVQVETAWGKSDPKHNIDVITALTASVTRK